MSRRRASDHTATVRGAVLGAIGGLLLGLVAMHGMSLDTTPTASVHASPAPSVVNPEPDTAYPLTAVTVEDQEGSSGIAKHCGLLVLCLSALAGAALLALALYVKLQRTVMALSPRALKVALAPFRPPRAVVSSLSTLSILRC